MPPDLSVAAGDHYLLDPTHLDYAPTIEGIACETAGAVMEGSTAVRSEFDAPAAPAFASTPSAGWRAGEEFSCLSNEVAHAVRSSKRIPGAALQRRSPRPARRVSGRQRSDRARGNRSLPRRASGGRRRGGVRVGHVTSRHGAASRSSAVSRQPRVVIDDAHNSPAAESLAATLVEHFGDAGPWTVVAGLTPHDPADLLAALDPIYVGRVVACTPFGTPRADGRVLGTGLCTVGAPRTALAP